MKSIKQVLAIWSIMFVFALYISSCCIKHYEIIGVGIIKSSALDRSVDIISDSITGPFKIDIHTEVEVTLNDISELGFTQGLAIACNDDLINVVNNESIEILFDKTFQFDNSDYKSGTDLALIPEIKNKVKNYGQVIIIEFDEIFFSKAVFEKEIYNLKINFMTSDNINFSNNIDLKMNI